MRTLYQDSGSVETVLTYSANYNGRPYPGLDPVKDAELIEAISGHFRSLAAMEPDCAEFVMAQA